MTTATAPAMHVIEMPGPGGPHLVGPFASFLEAKEYLLDACQNPSAGRVLAVEPIDLSLLPEPGL